jgi:hypothetical protein
VVAETDTQFLIMEFPVLVGRAVQAVEEMALVVLPLGLRER